MYMQDIQVLAPLHIAVRLMPQAIIGVVWSYLGQAVVSCVSGRVLMGIGGLGYLGGAVLMLFVKPQTSYWKVLFPSLCVTVIGADFQFIVSNVGSPHLASFIPSLISYLFFFTPCYPAVQSCLQRFPDLRSETDIRLVALHILPPPSHTILPWRRHPANLPPPQHLSRPRHNIRHIRRRSTDTPG